jgi:hypothetical protein
MRLTRHQPQVYPALSSAALVFLVCCAGGCTSTARDIATAATPAAERAGLHEANTPDSQQQLSHLLDSPAIQHAGQSIGQGVGIGLFNQANQLASGVESAADDSGAASRPGGPSTMPGAAAMVGLTHGGGLSGFVHSSVQEAFLAATDPQFRAGEQAMSESIGEGFVKGMITVLNKEGPAIGDTVHRQLGPIVQSLIRDQIAPAVRDMLQEQLAPAALQVWREGAVETLKLTVRPDLQPDVVQNAENASIGASKGTHQALVDSGFLTASGDLNPHVKLAAWTAIVAIGLVMTALFCLLVSLNLLVLHHWRRRMAKRADSGA